MSLSFSTDTGIFFRAPDSEAAFRPMDVGRAARATLKVTAPTNVAPSNPAGLLSDDQLVTEMKSAVNDILYMSEADDFEQWFASDLVDDPSLDEDGVKYAKAMQKTYALMKANCTDLKIVYAAGSDLSNSHDVGFIQIFIVGRTRNGSMITMHTAAVWT